MKQIFLGTKSSVIISLKVNNVVHMTGIEKANTLAFQFASFSTLVESIQSSPQVDPAIFINELRAFLSTSGH